MNQKIFIDDQNNIKVVQNFLSKPYFEDLQKILMGYHMPWFFNENSLTDVNDNSFLFTHAIFYKEHGWVGTELINNIIRPMLWNIKEHLNYSTVSRIKANLTTNRNKQVVHPTHRDWEGTNEDKYRIAVFHVNTCNGFTKVKDKKIENVENQLVIFNNVEHCYATATDCSSRVVINFNFIT